MDESYIIPRYVEIRSLQPGINYYVPPGDPEAMEAAVKQLTHDWNHWYQTRPNFVHVKMKGTAR